LARIIADSRCGVTVEAGNPKALVEAIQRLKSQPSERQRMSTAGWDLLQARFSMQRAFQSWNALLDGLEDGGHLEAARTDKTD
jgi:glycosyltransferase involved in cell wall biosynthesis